MKKIILSVFTMMTGVAFGQTYCTPQFTTGCSVGDEIDNFSTTGGITTNISNLQSGCSQNSYGDFTSMSADVFVGDSIQFTVQSGPSWSQGFRIWVDWNGDGDFTDPGEDVWNSGTSATTPFTGTIAVPSTVTPGAKRMRVRCDFANVPTDPCAQQSFGEVEDYTLTVVPVGPCSAPPTAGTTQASETDVCINTTIGLSLDGASFGTGQTYQWQESPDNTNWSDLLNDTLPAANVTVMDTTWYRCMLICSGDTAFSTPVQVNAFGGALAGTYTIDQLSMPSATNFVSFQEFFDALECGGVTAPVIVNVAAGSGPYNEEVYAGPIGGVDSINTITINGNGNTLAHDASGSADRTTLTLDGASWITFDNLIIEANGSTHGWVMHMTNGVEHVAVRNCSILASTTITGTFSAGIVASGSNTSAITYGDNASFVTIENNFFEGGYYAVSLNGEGSNNNSPGNKVLNNVMVDQRYYGLYLRAQENLEVMGNDISRPDRDNGTIFYALTARNGMPGGRIMNNRIHNTHGNLSGNTSTIYCLDFRTNSTSMDANNPLVVANNQVYDIQGEGLFYGIYTSNSQHTKIYHNTIVMDESSASHTAATRMFYTTTTATGQAFKNNIIYMNRGNSGDQHLVWVNTATSDVEIDNNVYFAPNLSDANVYFGRYSTDFSDLTDWQTANGGIYDQNAIDFDPTFIGGTVPDRYRPGAGAIKSLGANVQSLVPVDYDSVSRPTDPDPGAYEFTPLPCTGISDFTVDSLYPGGAVVSWTSDNITEWQVEWDSCGFVPGSQLGNLDPTVTTNQGYVLDSLPMGECICVHVREACPQGGYGPWSDPIEICVPIEDDAELVTLISPEDLQCGDSLMDVMVEIRNNGFNPITSLPIEVNISGDITENLTLTYTGNLLENEVDTVVVGTINSYWGGYVDVVASVNLPGDQLTSNDTVAIDSLFIYPFQPNVLSSEFCPGDTGVDLLAMPLPAGNYEWFGVPTGGTPLYTGDSVNVPTTSGTLYVGYVDLMDSLNTIQQGGSGCGAGNMFDITVNSSFEITGFTVRPFSTTTNMPISVYIVQGGYQGTTQADWTLVESGTIPSAVLNQPVRFDLTNNISVNQGTTYGIYLQFNASYTVGQNTYSNADMTLEAGLGLCQPFDYCCDPRTFNGAIHYGMQACSDVRTPVTPTEADSLIASFDFTQISHTVAFNNTSQNADSVVWDFGGVGTATGDSVSFQFPQTDSFTVCMVAYGPCGTDTVCETVWAENVSTEEHSLAGSLTLYPNPSKGAFDLSFDQPYISDVTLRLMDMNGKAIWEELLKNHDGAYHQRFERGDLSSGVYMLQIHNREGTIMRKVVINQ
ncbi:MAG: GEVED domain-containing protein [Cryomorphaceae bacterium]|nr:GEVED domain-containing protein [Cryomorphaceae bacterium]